MILRFASLVSVANPSSYIDLARVIADDVTTLSVAVAVTTTLLLMRREISATLKLMVLLAKDLGRLVVDYNRNGLRVEVDLNDHGEEEAIADKLGFTRELNSKSRLQDSPSVEREDDTAPQD